jgi:cytochrome c5
MKRMVVSSAGVTVLASLIAGIAMTGAASAARTASPQQQEVTLPTEVTTWLARDQVRRWAAMIEQGRTLFNDEGTCHFCHAQGAVGSPSGPDLTDAEWVQGDGSLENIQEVIFWGVRRRDFADPNRLHQMNPAGGMDLDLQQLSALTAYVWSLNNGTYLPQR